MNHIYKVIRCSSTGLFKAVSELGKSQGKGKGLSKKLLAVSVVAAIGMGGAQAGDVLSGTNNSSDAGTDAVVAGGTNNSSSGDFSVVAGGVNNTSSGGFSVVAGGGGSFYIDEDGVSKEYIQRNEASGFQSTVSGGGNNHASGFASTVSGGVNNTATGVGSVVAGGGTVEYYFNNAGQQTSAHFSNIASGDYSAVSGGSSNRTHSNYSTVGGAMQTQQERLMMIQEMYTGNMLQFQVARKIQQMVNIRLLAVV